MCEHVVVCMFRPERGGEGVFTSLYARTCVSACAHVCVCVCVCWRVGGMYRGVFVTEVVRGGSGKLIDGNRMFYGVAREKEREREFEWDPLSLSLTHTHTHTHTHMHVNVL